MRLGWAAGGCALACSLLLLSFGALAGCSSRPTVTSCADDLSGVWLADTRAPSGERMRFHVLDHGPSIAIFPMFDDAYPPAESPDSAGYDKRASDVAYAPASFELRRLGQSLVGTRSVRASKGGVVCRTTRPAAIRGCERDTLELSWIPTVRIDWPTCASTGASRYTRVRLAR
jgi:hypothetical protein